MVWEGMDRGGIHTGMIAVCGVVPIWRANEVGDVDDGGAALGRQRSPPACSAGSGLI